MTWQEQFQENFGFSPKDTLRTSWVRNVMTNNFTSFRTLTETKGYPATYTVEQHLRNYTLIEDGGEMMFRRQTGMVYIGKYTLFNLDAIVELLPEQEIQIQVIHFGLRQKYIDAGMEDDVAFEAASQWFTFKRTDADDLPQKDDFELRVQVSEVSESSGSEFMAINAEVLDFAKPIPASTATAFDYVKSTPVRSGGRFTSSLGYMELSNDYRDRERDAHVFGNGTTEVNVIAEIRTETGQEFQYRESVEISLQSDGIDVEIAFLSGLGFIP